jgi:hypothetical protein
MRGLVTQERPALVVVGTPAPVGRDFQTVRNVNGLGLLASASASFRTLTLTGPVLQYLHGGAVRQRVCNYRLVPRPDPQQP